MTNYDIAIWGLVIGGVSAALAAMSVFLQYIFGRRKSMSRDPVLRELEAAERERSRSGAADLIVGAAAAEHLYRHGRKVPDPDAPDGPSGGKQSLSDLIDSIPD